MDAERRMRQLRGLPVDDISTATPETKSHQPHERKEDYGHGRKRRRIAGEDDTERDIRYAREDQELSHQRAETAVLRKPRSIPLTDSNGNVNLFAAEATRNQKTANPEAVAEEVKKKREYEDQYTMRFSNAAGFKQDVGEKPWYSMQPGRTEKDVEPAAGKDVWGNDDPRRRERDERRTAADDPMVAMQRGVQGVRRVEKERREWRRDKKREVEDLVQEEKQRRRERKRSRKHGENDLEEFSLDAPPETKPEHYKHKDRHHNPRRRSHSKEHSPNRRHRYDGARAPETLIQPCRDADSLISAL